MAGHLGDVLCRRGGQVADHPRRFKLQQPNANDQPYSCSMDSPKVTAAGYKLQAMSPTWSCGFESWVLASSGTTCR